MLLAALTLTACQAQYASSLKPTQTYPARAPMAPSDPHLLGVPSIAPTPTPGINGTALAQLVELKIKGRAPHTGYARREFGKAWSDVDQNGCDTRVINTSERRVRVRSPALIEVMTHSSITGWRE